MMKTRARSSDLAPGAMAQAWISIAAVAVLLAAILVDHARGGELMDCEPQRVSGDGRHWAYRIIDGRECWYPGERGKPKGELRWSEAASAPQRSGVLEQAEVEGSPSEPTLDLAAESPKPGTTEAMSEEWHAAAADQLLAFTCCWPELPEAVPLPQPGPGRRQDQPPAWPLILLPLALCAIWLIRKLASKKLTGPLASDFGRSSVPPWWSWWQGAQRKGSAGGSSPPILTAQPTWSASTALWCLLPLAVFHRQPPNAGRRLIEARSSHPEFAYDLEWKFRSCETPRPTGRWQSPILDFLVPALAG